MQPEHLHDSHQPHPLPDHLPAHGEGGDRTKPSRSLAIALVCAAIFLLAAIAIAVSLLVVRTQGDIVSNSITHISASDDTKNVKSVNFSPPSTLPANYAKNDQSKNDAINVYYYDDAANCGITANVVKIPDGKDIKDVVAATATAASAQGVVTTASTQGATYQLKDASNGKTYTFDSLQLEQAVNVANVAFTKQHSILLYKQFGTDIASLSYACKDETWPAKQNELAQIVKTFTVNTVE